MKSLEKISYELKFEIRDGKFEISFKIPIKFENTCENSKCFEAEHEYATLVTEYSAIVQRCTCIKIWNHWKTYDIHQSMKSHALNFEITCKVLHESKFENIDGNSIWDNSPKSMVRTRDAWSLKLLVMTTDALYLWQKYQIQQSLKSKVKIRNALSLYMTGEIVSPASKFEIIG